MNALIGTQVIAPKTSTTTSSGERQVQHRALPEQVWAALSLEQQQQAFRSLVKVCRSLMDRLNSGSSKQEVIREPS